MPGVIPPMPIMGMGEMVRLAGFSSGGIVYASKGKYVNFEPKGTDTVPAMLTPGEFVVNAKASQKNLGLLNAINSGTMSKGGVVYLNEGGEIARGQLLRQLAKRDRIPVQMAYRALMHYGEEYKTTPLQQLRQKRL